MTVDNGWSFFDELQEKKVNVKNPELLAQEKSFKACFSTPDGKNVLKYLKSCTIDKPVLVSFYSEGGNTSLQMAYREGENNIMRAILRLAKKGDE